MIVFGLGRFGAQLLRRLTDAGYQALGVDLDPVAIRRLAGEGFRVRYGDVTEQEFWAELPLAETRWIVLAVPYGRILLTETDPRGGFLTAIRTHRFGGRVAITARDDDEARHLADGGLVDLILYPFDEAALSAARQIADRDEEHQGLASRGTAA
ncbi:NAD-binding protein [Aurantimonas endophytica]|uniref:NAD-binding protein n=1 Tax=Aurantimonas endophytica TaxID=1522175 RepID=UPI00338FEF88